MKVVVKRWPVGRYVVTLRTILPIRLSALHYGELEWDPEPEEGPMTEIEFTQYSNGLAKAIEEIVTEPGSTTEGEPYAEGSLHQKQEGRES